MVRRVRGVSGMLKLFAIGLSSIAMSSGAAFAQEDPAAPQNDGPAPEKIAQNVFYGGFGSANNDEGGVDSTPFVIGFMHQSATSGYVFGFDIAGEGAMLDSTWGSNEWRQSMSYNLLAGVNLTRDKNFRVDAGVLLGFRETFSDCPASYIGYQCYADEPPSTEYGFNYGAFVGVSFGSVMVGVRGTEESTQAMLGLRF